MPTISAKVQALIADQIICGKFAPGTRLDERVLAEQFNVSRTPVREALRQLAARGLTEILPMRGVVVMQVGVKELSEILQADCELEALCARLAAESMTAMEKTELEYIHQKAKEFVAQNDIDGYLDANREFHRLILEGSHNAMLSKLVGDIRDRLSPYRQYHPADSDRLLTSHTAHDSIVKAILKGEGEQAYLATRAHNLHLGSAALRALRQAHESGALAEVADQPKMRKIRAPKLSLAAKTTLSRVAKKPVVAVVAKDKRRKMAS